jgi:hypothetical protein
VFAAMEANIETTQLFKRDFEENRSLHRVSLFLNLVFTLCLSIEKFTEHFASSHYFFLFSGYVLTHANFISGA